MRAGDALSLILRSRLEEMCSYGRAALDWSDAEGVHDMRVASRRLRSAIKDFLPYLRRRKLRQAREDLRRVAHVLGAVRDHDVALIALEKLAREAPPELSAGIEQLAGGRRRKLKDARSQLEATLAEDALEQLQLEFNEALEESSKVSRDSSGDDQETSDDPTLQQVAREILDERLVDVQEMSASLFQPLEIEPLHQMRIAAKRLRYAMELFTPCLGEALKPFCKEIARIQDSLGELHDCDMWIVEIGAGLKGAREERVDVESRGGETKGSILSKTGTTHDGLMPIEHQAMFWLLDYFVRERTEHFRAALERWREWRATGFQERLVATLNSQPLEPSSLTSSSTERVSHKESRESD